MSGGIYETLFPDGPAPPPVAAGKPAPAPDKSLSLQIPVTQTSPVSQVPAAVWKNLRLVSRLPQSFDIRHGFIIGAASLLMIGASLLAATDRPLPRATVQRQPEPPVSPPAEHPKETAAVPLPTLDKGARIPATAPTAMATWPNLASNTAFNDAVHAAPKEEFQNVRALQEHMRSIGIFKDASTGNLDKPTRKAFAVLASLSGQTVSDVPSAMAALQIANSKMEAMLPHVGHFPLGDDVPSWLLASLTENDLTAIGDKFNSVMNIAPGPFSLSLSDPTLELHGQLLADPERGATSLTCVGFTLLFTKGALQKRVISRACRNPSSWGWRLAPT